MYDHKEIDNTKRIQNLYIWPIHIEIFNNFDTQIVNNLNSKRDIAFMTPTYPNKYSGNSRLIRASGSRTDSLILHLLIRLLEIPTANC